MKHGGEALALLLVGALAQFAWKWAPPAAQGDVWNINQALLAAMLLAMVGTAYPARHVRAVCALLMAWQVLTAGCSLAWLVAPWPVLPGQGQCSAALDWPLGLASAWLVAMLALRLHRDGQQNNSSRETDT